MKELKAHKDIVNNVPSVLIIGYGWVGRFLGSYFKNAHYVDEDNKLKGVDGALEKMAEGEKYDFAFVCVPTPMLDSGKCDTSIVENVVDKWKSKVNNFCIKSTVQIGTCDYLKKKHGVRICFSPEYLGETVGHPLVDSRKETFIILGGDGGVTKRFAELWSLATNSYTKIYQVSSKTAELCKLMENSWIATKVMFCNEFFGLAESIGIDWNELREVWLADPRVSRSHTYVYRGNRGFSGKCLPKDINNLCWYFRNEVKYKARLMETLLELNNNLRKKKGYKDSIPLIPVKKVKKASKVGRGVVAQAQTRTGVQKRG